jgi:hypothetical protein
MELNMARTISRAVQKIQREDSEEKYRQQVETEQFWDDYKKEQDKRKKLDMLSNALKDGVVYFS